MVSKIKAQFAQNQDPLKEELINFLTRLALFAPLPPALKKILHLLNFETFHIEEPNKPHKQAQQEVLTFLKGLSGVAPQYKLHIKEFRATLVKEALTTKSSPRKI